MMNQIFFSFFEKGKKKRGFLVSNLLLAGIVLFFIFVFVYQLLINRYFGLNVLQRSENLRFLGEAGISYAVQKVRLAVKRTDLQSNPKLWEYLTQTGVVPKTSIVSYLPNAGTWDLDLRALAREVSPNASLEVDGWTQDFELTETDTDSWNDRVAKRGTLFLQATARIGTATLTVYSRRQIWVGSILPPVTTKFSLRLNESNGNPDRFNVVRNDYAGNIAGENQPLYLINHATPTDPFSPQSEAVIADTEKNDNYYEKRGWVWFNGGKTALQLSSGGEGHGQMFHFFQIDFSVNPTKTKEIGFYTPPANLPQTPAFADKAPFYWGTPDGQPLANYTFKQWFLPVGFHDISDRVTTGNAMYEGNILSESDKSKYGSKSACIRPFGKCQKGFQSATKIIGNVYATFARFSILDVLPEAGSAAESNLKNLVPPATFYLYSLGSQSFDTGSLIEFNQRLVGPCASLTTLFTTYASYTPLMSGILEYPYAEMYNTMLEIPLPSQERFLPPKKNTLKLDSGSLLELKKDGDTIYSGPVKPPKSVPVMEKRVQIEIRSIQQFWDRFYDPVKKVLNLDSVVRILNPEDFPFVVPPAEIGDKLDIYGGGMIVLEKGDLIIKGVEVKHFSEALSIAAPNSRTVTFLKLEPQPVRQLNIFAPLANLKADGQFQFYGSLELLDIVPDDINSGGEISYRTMQDPTQPEYRNFYRVCFGEADKTWYE